MCHSFRIGLRYRTYIFWWVAISKDYRFGCYFWTNQGLVPPPSSQAGFPFPILLSALGVAGNSGEDMAGFGVIKRGWKFLHF